MAKDDPMAIAKFFDEAADHLEPLRALTLRQMPFADLLTRARRREGQLLETGARLIRYNAEALAQGAEWMNPEAKPEELEAHARETDELASLVAPPLLKSGRHAKYTIEHLKLVARLYSEAYTTHASSSPTKDVAEKLHLSRNQVAKLVMRCRDPQVGLLDPTEKRKAGGAKQSSRGKQGS